MLIKPIVYFGKPRLLACDGECSKAWGINSRPTVQLSTDPDDYEYLADGELGEAPTDPSTYEGGVAKPTQECDKLNKWCARECERSGIVDYAPTRCPGVITKITLHNWSERLKNKGGSDE